MPNTDPPLDNPALIDFILDRAASPEAGGVFVAPVGALTRGMKGEQLADLAALRRAGIVAASEGISLAILAAGDVIGGVTSGLLTISAAITANNA